MKYWGAIAPIADHVLWCGRQVPVTFIIQSAADELEILAQAANGPPVGMRWEHGDQRDYLETFYRTVRALVSVDGEVVEEAGDERLAMMALWLDPIIWELRDAYARAKTTCLLEEHTVFSDPEPEARRPAESGGASGQPAISPAAGSLRRRQRTASTTKP